MSANKGRAGQWTGVALAASYEREEAIRAQRIALPSTSITPARCSTCGHWNTKENWNCTDCGLPFVAREEVGLARVSLT